MLEYTVTARRRDAHVAEARCNGAALPLDIDPGRRQDAFNPAELLLAAVGACMLKGIERAIPMLGFDLRGSAVRLHGVREERPPRLVSITYELVIDTDESDRRLELLHQNVRKFGTIYNTVGAATALSGTIRRGSEAETVAPEVCEAR